VRVKVRIHVVELGKFISSFLEPFQDLVKKGKVHPCTGTEALCRPYGP